ncbi:MAG: Na+/H+ antiporter NhaA [Actinomycetales bacterium]|nr:Na+/H+ antiporter NhaA [Actinomycetales bacterium]
MRRSSRPTSPPGSRHDAERSPERRFLTPPSAEDLRELVGLLRVETVGGALLLAAAAVALVWANSPWQEGYQALLTTTVGPAGLHLDLDVQHWAADGLLAVFFFVAGLELKRELVDGELREPARAAVPVVAAAAGVVLPALVYLLVVGAAPDGAAGPDALDGWAVPVATDIAFALAILAVVGRHLPSALRAFLLALAVVDDLIAIVVIAVFYTDDLSPVPLLVALVPVAAFGLLVHRRITSWWLLVPLACIAWGLVHASGVHATVTGVLLALTVPAGPEQISVAERLEHRVRPLSAGVAVPVFALTGAGVAVSGDVLGEALRDPVTLGVVAGLVVGKPVGVLLGTWAAARFTRARLAEGLAWSDLGGAALLAGVGFTVSLLVGELAYGTTGARSDHVTLAVLSGSLLSAALACAVLLRRDLRYRTAGGYDEADGHPDTANTTSRTAVTP